MSSLDEKVYEAKDDIILADKLIEDYLPFIKSETSKLVNRMVSEGVDDEVSIAMLGFHDAIKTYSRLRGKFLTYAAVVMKRRIIDYLRKENRHTNLVSLDMKLSDESDIALVDEIKSDIDEYENLEMRDATKEEILELTGELKKFNLSLTDVADNSPKEKKTLQAVHKALDYIKRNPIIIDDLKRTNRLPLNKISEETGVNRKTLERHRRYLVALLVIYSNGYEIIRGHLKQVLPKKGRDGK